MAITVTEFICRFPEFSDDVEYPEIRLQMFIDDAACYMGSDESRWCDKYNLAQAYYAAHLLAIADNSAAGDSNAKAGPINNKSAGGVSVQRQVESVNRSETDTLLATTIYGQQYLSIRNTCFIGVLTAVRC